MSISPSQTQIIISYDFYKKLYASLKPLKGYKITPFKILITYLQNVPSTYLQKNSMQFFFIMALHCSNSFY